MTDTLDYIEEEDPALVEYRRLRSIDPRQLKAMIDEFRDGTQPGRNVAEKARRYFNDEQITGDMERALKRSYQPRVIRNEIKPAVNGILGIVQQARVDPRAYPRNPDNEDQADVASKALRYVADANRFHKLKVDAAENHLIEGVFGYIVEVDEKSDVLIKLIRADEVLYDPRSTDADFQDARFKGIGKWMYEADLARMFPLFATDLSQAFTTSWGSEMGLDRPDKPENLIGTNWVDPKKRRIFIVELYHREDEWMRSVFYVGGVLDQQVSPYLDEDQEPTCPIVLGSCYINQENQRYGVVASMLSPQDELNAYASRALHLAKSRQLQVADPSFPPDVDSKTASREAAKPDGVIPTGYQVVPTTDLMNGIQIMMSEARQALVRQAPTPAVLADASAQNQSGRSRLVLQQAGMTEIARALGRFEDGENAVYRQIWQRLKQFKTEPWWIRITGEEGKTEFEGVNMPVGPDGEPIPPEMAQQMMQAGMQPEIKNRLATMDVDIEVETIPDTANLQAEQFEALAPMLPLLAEAKGPEKAFMIGLAMSNIPEKGRIKEMINAPEEMPPEQQEAMQAQQAQQQQLEQMQMQIAQMMAESEIAKNQSTAMLNTAKANATQADTVLKAAQFESGAEIDAS